MYVLLSANPQKFLLQDAVLHIMDSYPQFYTPSFDNLFLVQKTRFKNKILVISN